MRSKRNSVVMVIVLTLIFLAANCSRGNAQWYKEWWDKQKKGVEELKDKVTQGVEKKVAEFTEVGPGAGLDFAFYYPALTAINAHLNSGGSSFTDMHGGFFWGGTLRYSLTPEFQVGYYGMWGGCSAFGLTAGDTIYTTEARADIGFQAGVVALKPRLSKNFRMFFGVAIGAVNTKYKEDSGYRPGQSREVKEWAGTGIGYLPFIGFQYKPNFLVGIGLEYGYMIATIPSADMRPQAGTPYTDSSNSSNNCPAVDLNGSMVKLAIQLHY